MDRVRILILLTALLVPACPPLRAASDPNQPQPADTRTARTQEDGKSGFSLLLDDDSTASSGDLVRQFFLAILFVVVLGTAAWYLSRRVMPRLTLTRGRHVRVVETVSLGPRKQLHLLEIGEGRQILVGSTSDHVSFLADVTGSVPAIDTTDTEKAAG